MTEKISKAKARSIWLKAQALTERTPFGQGPGAAARAIEHLGYVQIDTIHVIERCHHHILYTRIPDYKRSYLHQAQATDKTVFEYWTHALSYIPTKDFRFFMPEMKRQRIAPGPYFSAVKPEEMSKILKTIKKEGPLSIRDMNDEVLVEKNHPWASRKPSKKALQWGFYSGRLVICERQGMLKKYELAERYFQWRQKPKAPTEKEIFQYITDRGLRSQGVVSLDSLCHLNTKKKPGVLKILENKVRQGELISVQIEGLEKSQFWMSSQWLDEKHNINPEQVHLLSPFDPLVIQRKRLKAFFEYEHRFEAYVPKEKRKFGYFALPVLMGDHMVAAMDLKTDRQKGKLLIQQWSWLGKHKSAANKKIIEAELDRFEQFQLLPGE